MTSLLQQFSDGMADVFDQVRRSVVQITDGQGSVGAGTICHADGLIITNAHVVSQRDHRGVINLRDLSVILPDGRSLQATTISIDPENDLAALSIDAENLPAIRVGDSATVRPGQAALAVGHPWGVRDALTAGVVISVGGDLPEMYTGREWIALNLQLRPGHSGGPLVDTSGRLIGVNTMITGPEVGFAIPSKTVKVFLKETLGEKTASAVMI
jgi:S1-C subfamily serine protease